MKVLPSPSGPAGTPPEPASGETDKGWVRALQRREAWAWERLQDVALDAVFGYVYLRCRRREDAEDVTAEVFAAAVASIGGFRGGARVQTWLIGIARRKLADAARRRARRPEVLEAELRAAETEPVAGVVSPSDREHLEAEVERRDQVARVRRYVLQLPEAQREALWLHCVDQLTLAETAAALGRSEDAVKGLIRRARLTLHERLAAHEAPIRRPGEATDVESSLSTAAASPPAVPGN